MNKSCFIILFFGIISKSRGDEFTRSDGWCMAYDSCGYNTEIEGGERKGEIPCLNNLEAPILRKGTLHFDLLESTCPDLVNPDGVTKACCSIDQLLSLTTQLTASELIFQRCPSCVWNFRNLYCQITCNPNQATFYNATGLQYPDSELYPAIETAQIYIESSFATGVHSSCKDVVFPQTNGKAMTLVCNGFSGDDCSPQDFLNYLGSTNNGVAPMNQNFQQIGNQTGPNSDEIPSPPEGMKSLNAETISCSLPSPVNGSYACSCTDCAASCPIIPPPPPPPDRFKIGNADGVEVIMLIIFLSLVIVFVSYLLLKCYCYNKKKTIVLNTHDRLKSETNEGFPVIHEEDISRFQKAGKKTQDMFQDGFQWWGTFVARHPLWVIVPCLGVIVALCFGIQYVILTNDPIELWSSEGSRVREEKDYFDAHFGAFYRSEMVIMTLKPEFDKGGSNYTSFTGVKYNFSEILSKEYLLEFLALQNEIRYMTIEYEDNDGNMKNGSLQDICFKPLEPTNNNCTITSAINYWQNDPNELNKTAPYVDQITETEYLLDYRDHFLYCVQAPSSLQDTTALKQNCMGDFGGPVFPFLAVGGQGEDGLYNEAKALILTFVINNYAKEDVRTKITKVWEKQFLAIMEKWSKENKYFDCGYFSERSPEEELERSSKSDVVVFAASYLAIFIYITIALGTYTSFKRIPVESKVSLGIAGILVILLSVFTSIGFFGYVGYASSLIVIEVVPFLVLAIGADNIFILVLEYQRTERLPGEELPNHIGRVFGEVAPSMLLCSLTECVAFFLGALTDMPAVKQFALAAGVAILFDFLLQITMFLAVLSLDARRQEGNRVDIACCFKIGKAKKEATKSYLETFFKEYFAPFLMNDLVRAITMIGFGGLTCWSIVLTTKMKVGLDQDLSVPLDSYVLKYFEYMENYLDVGVPVYFVSKNPYNFSNPDAGSYICASAGCDTYSLTQQISYASQNPDYWRIETPAASWYDDYLDWISRKGIGGQKSCCRSLPNNTDEFCPATNPGSCIPCLEGESYTSEQFMKYLPWFLEDNPGLECNKGGHAAYGSAVNISTNEFNQSVVQATHFSSYHSVCIESVDCTENLIKARELAANITATLKAANTDENGLIIGNEDDYTVYPYCLYYVFYEQYLTIVEDTMFQIGICLIPTFVFTFILLGFDWYSGFITIITILMIVVDTAGLCSLWGVDLNAVSLINLVAAIGLSVEFISHVVRTFSLKVGLTKKGRVIDSMATMGPAVFAGVALTNLPGIIVLNWATAQLIQVFFFRMCLVITLLGTAHGLVFLPVFLSYFGPPVNKAILFNKQKMENRASIDGKENVVYENEKIQGDMEEIKMAKF